MGKRTDDVLPWTLIRDVDPTVEDEICFTTEAFCGVLASTSLPGATHAEYLAAAVDFCNDRVWGTLSATVIVHPKILTLPGMADALEDAIARLRYGTVAINHWPALAYGLCSTTWGAYPGHTLDDIQSGIGVVHNTFLFDKPEKTVIRGPFRVSPTPPWFVSNKRTHAIARRLTSFEAQPSVLKLPGIIVNSLMG